MEAGYAIRHSTRWQTISTRLQPIKSAPKGSRTHARFRTPVDCYGPTKARENPLSAEPARSLAQASKMQYLRLAFRHHRDHLDIQHIRLFTDREPALQHLSPAGFQLHKFVAIEP